jgi:hypothetical protein
LALATSLTTSCGETRASGTFDAQQFCGAACTGASGAQQCAADLEALEETATETGCTQSMAALVACLKNTPSLTWCDIVHTKPSACESELEGLGICIAKNYSPSLCGRAVDRELACMEANVETSSECYAGARCAATCTLAAGCADLVAFGAMGCPPAMNAYTMCLAQCPP